MSFYAKAAPYISGTLESVLNKSTWAAPEKEFPAGTLPKPKGVVSRNYQNLQFALSVLQYLAIQSRRRHAERRRN